DIRSPRLEPGRRLCIRRTRKRHGTDHLPTRLVGRHLLEPYALAIKNADAGRSVNLVPAESIKIAVHVLYIDGQMDGTLRSVHEDDRTVGVRCLRDFAHWENGTEGVRYVRQGYQLCPFRKMALDLAKRNLAVFGDGCDD